MRKVRRLGAPGPEVNCPAGWLFHVGNALLGLNPLGRKSVRHGSSVQTSAVLPRRPRKRRGWSGVSFVYLAWGRSAEILPLPPALSNGREKGGIADDWSSSLSAVDTFASWGSQMGHSLPTLLEGFHNPEMRLLCFAA